MREEGDLSRARTTGEAATRASARKQRWHCGRRSGGPASSRFEDVFRRVHADACIEVETNRYCMQRRWLIGERSRSRIWPTYRCTYCVPAKKPPSMCDSRASVALPSIASTAGHRRHGATTDAKSSKCSLRCGGTYESPGNGACLHCSSSWTQRQSWGPTTVQELSRSRWRLRPGRPVPFQQMAKQQ